MKKIIATVLVSAFVLVGCSEGNNTVSETNDSEMKLLTETIETDAGTATCVIALNTQRYNAPALQCFLTDSEG